MIVATNAEANSKEFETLLCSTVHVLDSKAIQNPTYFKSKEGVKLEKEVYDAMLSRSIGSVFENYIDLHSGHAFPDIVAKKYWGVEVKSTTGDHWKCTGNSVLESTRVEDVKRIYLVFGKLAEPIKFKYRKYEECLYNIAVTHSPRYLVDMKTPPGESVFDKMHIEYETLRKQDHPIRTIIKYFRKEVKKNDNGEDLWWLETESNDIPIQTVYVRLWGNLTKQEKEQFRIQAMALFPEIFGNDAKKYAKLAVWLAGTHGIVAPSLRDAFTAGGQVSLTVDGKTIPDVPKIFKHLQDDLPMVITTINTLDDAKIEYYWGKKVPQSQRIKEWTKMVNENALRSLGDCNLDVEKLIHM